MPSFSASQDLLGLFQLQGVYDKYVKPHAVPVDQWQTQPKPMPDKGKGKERDEGEMDVDMDADATNDLNPDESSKDSKKRKKEGTYKHLIKAIVGMYLRFQQEPFHCLKCVAHTHLTPKGNIP